MDNARALVAAMPGWLRASIILAAGWLFARVMRPVIAKVLRRVRFDGVCERAGVSDFLKKGEVPFACSELVARGLYWVILVGVLLEAARLLDIRAMVEFRQRVVSAVPAIMSALLVLAVGFLVVAFLAGFVRTLARNAGSPYADLWSRITRLTGVILVLGMALEQAEIHGSVMPGVIHILIAAIAFGAALAFGLGCKDMARAAMEKMIANLKERHRDSSKPDMEG